MSGFSNAEVRPLEAAILYTPPNLRAAHITRLQRLISDLVPDRLYTFDYVFKAVTRFKPGANGEAILRGRTLIRDLSSMARRITSERPIPAGKGTSPVVPMSRIARNARVSVSTVRRWSALGLPLCYYQMENGRRSLAAPARSVRAFMARKAKRSRTYAGRLTDDERAEILARAKAYRKDSALTPAMIIRLLVEGTGRSTATIRRVLRANESRRPRDKDRAAARGLDEAEWRELIRLYTEGTPVRELANRYDKSVPVVYRILHEALLERAKAMTIKYIPSPEFGRPRAERVCLGSDGLFTYPPELGEDAIEPPENVPPYLRDLYRIPLLERHEEKFLFRKYNYIKYRMAMLQEQIRERGYRTRLMEKFTEWARAAAQVRRILIRCNLRLVVSIAKRHTGPLMNLFELVSEGNVCLIRAVKCYDYRREARFATYATWALSKHFARVVPEENYRLSAFVTGRDEMLSTVGDPAADPRERQESLSHIRTVLARASSHLSDREREIVESHYGTNGKPPKTLAEIGQAFGLTRERIRQIELRALSKLRSLIRPDTLETAT